MEFIKTPIEGLSIIKPKVFEDERGHFYESYNKAVIDSNFLDVTFLQDNQSLSQKNVLRGLHFQNPPFGQVKLIRVIKGAVLDVVVDVRKKSPTYGKHYKIEINEHNKLMVWIPEGFAHGFLTLEDNTIFQYKCSNIYNKASECCISWNDPDLNINWEVSNPIISDKDKQGIAFKNYASLF